MTVETLNGVRDLQKKIRNLERHVQDLRISMDNIVPVLDGLPHSNMTKSRVEKIALMIVDAEHELDHLRGQLPEVQSTLAEVILREVDDPLIQALLILRYVEGLTFKEISCRMKWGLRNIFKLHEKFLKKGICGHIATQNQC